MGDNEVERSKSPSRFFESIGDFDLFVFITITIIINVKMVKSLRSILFLRDSSLFVEWYARTVSWFCVRTQTVILLGFLLGLSCTLFRNRSSHQQDKNKNKICDEKK